MKTQRMLLLVVLGALFAREAQAFYNPSAGRWLSRDPIAELAFQSALRTSQRFSDTAHDGNAYLFARNEGISAVDLLGLCVPVNSGPGTLTGGLGTVIIHHPFPGIHTSYPPVTDTFVLTCPASRPYLMTWGLASSAPYAPVSADSFPSGWALMPGSPSGGPGTYTFILQVPSSIVILDKGNRLPSLYIVGCCTCSPYSIARNDPPPPPEEPMEEPPQDGGF